VPSTTATSLTSLGTGAPPGSHGVLGYTTRIPGTLTVLNALRWNKDVDPTVWQAQPTAFSRLAAAGVHTTVVNKREFEGSGLTVASCRGAEFVGVDRPGERLVAVRAAARRTPSLTYSYDGDLDWTGHRYGVDSEQWRAQLAMTDLHAERLRESLPDGVRLVVVADHGMVDVRAEDRTDLDQVPGLQAGLVLVAGEARFRHLYCRAGAIEDVVAAWRAVLGERAHVLTRDDAIARGWFGPVLPELEARVGEVVVACRGSHAVLSSANFPLEARLVGMHGSLTPVEMRIPVLVA
jgi:predicted AlkP superfamily pyrophosphatase or phosphodiesterase